MIDAHKHIARLALALALTVAVASPAMAASAPKTRLVDCGAQSCLVISGQRDDSSSKVSINGREVSAQGGRRWHVKVPVDTVRAWSAPYARTITISVAGASNEAKLPIGMMGHANLAMLVIRVK